MKELCRARDTGDQVLGLVISPSALENLSSKKSVRHQSTLVCFQDELTTDLELGVRYNIPGLQTNEHFLAWNVQRWVPSTVAKIHRQVPLSFYLPPTISTLQAKLGEYCSHSPWALVATLAAQLASDLFPTTTLLHLKLGLLLSLATQGRSYESRPPVPILAVGSDYLIAHRLLSRVSVLANRCVTNGSSLSWGSLHGTAHHDEQGNCWLEAGYLLLASTGVCFLGDWAKYKSNNLRSAILSAIESGQVTIDTQMLPFSKSAVSSKFPLQCSVWTYRCWAPGGKEAEKTQLHTLINVFGMPYFADPDADADILAENILQRAIDTEKKTKKPYYIIPDQELQEYLTMVTTQPVKIGNKASKLIQDYFVASRRLRSHWLPVGAVSTITSLSVAHARLAMRQEVISADVAAVIYLYENSMRTLFGHSYVTPPPKPESLDISSLPVQVDNQMRVFTKWLDKHIKSLLGDSTYNTVPEE
ncbi:minichromosome maintenance domain-containing protein 2 [Periplaneta americana]|uniref:minichromosome maintenance domain-containing protein 2 n=1 Tax=Periplaneta americana TaxID=6978 RepID=UPI0037E7ECCA